MALRRALPVIAKILLVSVPVLVVAIEVGAIPSDVKIHHPATDKHEEYTTTYNILYFAFRWISHVLNNYGGLITAIATVFLAIFTFTLWSAGERQARLIIDGRRTAHRQFMISTRQTDIAERQQGLLNAQFFATHRPRIVLKDVFVNEEGDVTLELTNVGGSGATIVGGFVAVAFVEDERRFKDMREGSLEGLERIILRAGELRQFSRSVPAEIRSQFGRMQATKLFHLWLG